MATDPAAGAAFFRRTPFFLFLRFTNVSESATQPGVVSERTGCTAAAPLSALSAFT